MVSCGNIYTTFTIYTPPSPITELTKVFDKCRSNLENIVVLGDFNM